MTKSKTQKTQIRFSPNRVARALDRVSAEPTMKGCLLWEGGVNGNGYGCVRLCEKRVKTHRLAWSFGLEGERHGALPPPDVVIRHRCDTPRCCNPDHLQAGSKADNSRDMVERGRCRPARGEAHYSNRRPDLVARGEANGNAKLSDAAVAKVFSLRAEGLTQREIAEKVGCSRGNVGRILLGRTRAPLAPKKPA